MRLVEHAGVHLDATAALALDPQQATDASDPALVAALGVLTESEAEVVQLWAWEQLEPREIALAMDMTANAVSVALSRAKRKLAQQLDRQDRLLAGHIQGASDDRKEASDD